MTLMTLIYTDQKEFNRSHFEAGGSHYDGNNV